VISETEVEKCVNWLRDTAEEFAKARAERLYMETYLKTVLAQEMAKHDGSVAAAEIKARCSDSYLQTLQAYREAVEADERNRFLREARVTKVEVWRTQSSNERALGKV
jgi:hypothetical protein